MKKIIFLLGVLFLFTACQYEVIKLPYVVPPPPIDTTVDLSFDNEILPIFTTDDNCTLCHAAGKTAPDLSTANAYQSLVSGGFVVANDPEASTIYTYVNPAGNTHVWKRYTAYQAELVYTWINQGAKDN